MNFHIVHLMPFKDVHGPNGYKEVIESLMWGLRQLGCAVEYGVNEFSSSAVNIVFGAQMMDVADIHALPNNTVVYNLEQIRGLSPQMMRPQMRAIAERCRIWDYSAGNVQTWKTLGARDVSLVPIGYAPVLSRIERLENQDIDVLIYGLPGKDRLEAFYYLADAGLATVFLCGLYGHSRDQLIARSKLILNVSLYVQSKVFETVRVSYLLANSKAVIGLIDQDTLIDDDLRCGIKCTTRGTLVDDCVALAQDEAARAILEARGFEIFQQRDICRSLMPIVGKTS